MKVMSAKEAKNAFGTFIDTAQREPVLVTKRNRMVGVFLSIHEIEGIPKLKESLLKQMDAKLENPLFSMLGANKAHRAFASANEADHFLEELRNEWK